MKANSFIMYYILSLKAFMCSVIATQSRKAQRVNVDPGSLSVFMRCLRFVSSKGNIEKAM